MDFINYKFLGDRVRRQRQQMKLTQEQLAEQIGVSHSFVGHIERGTRKCSLETLVALCNSLEVSADFLLQDSLPLTGFSISDQLPPDQRIFLADIFRSIEHTMIDWHDSKGLKRK